MGQEFEVGDRFTLEFEVTGRSWQWYECQSPGGDKRAFPPSDMANAILIHRAEEPPKLDVTKRMRMIPPHGVVDVECLGVASNGMLIVRFPDGSVDALPEGQFENIPEPEQVLEYRIAVTNTIGGWRCLWADRTVPGDCPRARVTWSESQGWRIEEVEGES